MRAGGGHLREVGFEGSACLVFRVAEQRGVLPLIYAVMVDLLVVEPGGADEVVRPKLRKERWAQARICG